MRYKITVVQDIKYTETIVGETDSINKAMEIMTLMLEVFPGATVSIEVVEAKSEPETETETEED